MNCTEGREEGVIAWAREHIITAGRISATALLPDFLWDGRVPSS